MSADEDTELRDLVAQTLEANGVLGKIRAQLRASVFLALEEQESIQNKTPFANAELKKFVNTKEGRLVAGLVREFLEHFNMEFTLAVFDPESNIGDQYEGRGSLARDLDIIDTEDSVKQPLLVQVLNQGGAAPNTGRKRSTSTDEPVPGPTPGNPTSDNPSSGAETDQPSDTKKSSEGSQGAGGSSVVDNNNKKNLDSEKFNNDVKVTQKPKNSFFAEDGDDDPFFDDPIPSNNNTKSFTSDKTKKDVKFDAQKTEKRTPSGGLTSLAGLPSLAPGDSSKPPKSPDLEKDIKAIDRRMTDLGFDVPDDDLDYDDDFESSNVSPFGVTPRSARSDHNLKSIEDELEEEIEEDLSGGEDLLKSDNSGMDDLTTDRTVSPDNHSHAIDYMEDVMVP